MYDVLVVVNCVLFESISVLDIVLLSQTGLSIRELLFLHDIIICAVNDNGGEKFIEIGA
jgi:hypothetical protein